MSRLPAADLDQIFNHTVELWEELRGQRIFITGGTGFFGIWLLESFLHAHEKLDLKSEMLVLTRNPDSFKKRFPHLASSTSIKFLAGDVRSFEFPKGEFSHVIHAATEASVKLNAEDPLLMADVVVNGTRRVLDFARSAGTKKFLFTSSGAVYGRQPPDLLHTPEDYPGAPSTTHPLSAYGEGKRYAELLCSIYSRQYGFESKIARCFAFVGPHLPLDGAYAMGNFIGDALKGEPIQVNGDGTPYRSYLYASDLTVWLWKILCQGKSLRPYNVGSDQGLPVVDVARLVAAVMGGSAPIPVQIKQAAEMGRSPERYVPSTRRALDDLGLRVSVELPEAVRRTGEWHRGHFAE